MAAGAGSNGEAVSGSPGDVCAYRGPSASRRSTEAQFAELTGVVPIGRDPRESHQRRRAGAREAGVGTEPLKVRPVNATLRGAGHVRMREAPIPCKGRARVIGGEHA